MDNNSADTKRAILAVVLSGIVLFGWQYFYGNNAPVYAPEEVKKEAVVDTNTNSTNNVPEKKLNSDSSSNVKVVNTFEEITLKFEDSFYTINSHLEIVSAKTKTSNYEFPNPFGLESNSLEINKSGQTTKPFFNFEKVNDSTYKIYDQKLDIKGTISIVDNEYLNLNLNSLNPFKVNFNFKANESEGGSAFDYTNIKNYVYLTEELKTVTVGDDEEGDVKVNWFGIDYDYHLFSIIPENATQFLFKTTEEGVASFKQTSAVNDFNLKYIYTKKEYDHLVELGHNLSLAVDFGIMKFIALPILRGLQFFYTVFPNYGISIILLTILIRMLTFPLQYKSFKSMKKMQTIQPELKKIKEKFKDDPQRQQKETMALFKKAGANPIGGCLPMLLQMPIFFAFYKVLYSAVELVDAPFLLWITDLSAKDEFYVLPVLMAVAMFLNTKLTPTTSVDPAQQKIMMFMPLMFGFMMKDLPAGLTLYIFISTLVGMLQQLFVYKRTA